MMDDLPRLLLIAGIFALAGLVKGVLGLGLPTVAIGLLSLVMRPVEAAALLVVPAMVTNGWQLAAGGAVRPLLVRFRGLLVTVVLGTWAGAGVLAGGSARWAVAALGVALAAYAVLGLTRVRMHVAPAAERWAGPVVGGLTGLVAGATGVFVVPMVPYLSALGLERDALVHALGVAFTVSTLALTTALLAYGAFPLSAAWGSVLAVGPALVGMAAGGWVRGRVRAERFRVWFFVGLLVLAAELVARGV